MGSLEREGWRGRDEVGEDHHCDEMRGREEEREGDEDQEVGDTACGGRGDQDRLFELHLKSKINAFHACLLVLVA